MHLTHILDLGQIESPVPPPPLPLAALISQLQPWQDHHTMDPLFRAIQQHTYVFIINTGPSPPLSSCLCKNYLTRKHKFPQEIKFLFSVDNGISTRMSFTRYDKTQGPGTFAWFYVHMEVCFIYVKGHSYSAACDFSK